MSRVTVQRRIDDTPVTWIVLIAYVTLAFLTDPVSPTTGDLVDYGACSGILVQDGEPWRLLTYAFLHGGFMHLAFISYFMYVFGPQLELRLGSVRFALLYAVGALGGGVAGCLWHDPAVPLVGGSGAVFGMLGGAVALLMRQGRTQLEFLEYHGTRNLLVLIAGNLVLGWLLPFVSNAAHIGGLIAGYVLVFCFIERGRGAPDRTFRAIQAGWIALLASLTLYVTEPVVRWDHLLFAWDRSRTAQERQTYLDALAEDPENATRAALQIEGVLEGMPEDDPARAMFAAVRAHLLEAARRAR